MIQILSWYEIDGENFLANNTSLGDNLAETKLLQDRHSAFEYDAMVSIVCVSL